MIDILAQIVDHKRKEVAGLKRLHPAQRLEKSIHFKRQPYSLRNRLLQDDKAEIIAEIKRKSPSKGVINQLVSVEKTSMGYVQAGAAALSILTDFHFFGGSNDDLMMARMHNDCPILRKDFIVDEYQILEAKSIGADVILLIAAVLDTKTVKKFCDLSHALGLEVLLEIHDEEEFINNGNAGADVVGVNNRNLKTFEISLETSKRLSRIIPESTVKISESGIDSAEVIMYLKDFGFRGFLIGQTFMRTSSPEAAAMYFMKHLRSLEINARVA